MADISSWPYRVAQPKDPGSVLDYEIDWSSWLADGETIVSSEWSVEDDSAAIDSSTHTDTAATAWVSGGTVGVRLTVTNRITTTLGRIDERSIVLKIKDL